MRPILAEAVELARRALLELQPDGVGEHLGVTSEDEYAATHRFASTLPGYRGWQWAVVVAAPPEAERATVSESALLPGPEALTAPDFVPWDRRVRPGDLAPGDLLAPQPDDPRLVPGYLVTGDPVVDEVAEELGQGRPQVLSREGREEAAERWFSEYGPDTDMARAAPSTCRQCGFFVPLAGALRAAYGVCANAMGADGRVVHVEYGCGAHSNTELPTGGGSPLYEAYDDAAVEMIAEGEWRGPGTPVAEAVTVGEPVDAPEAVAGASEAEGTTQVVVNAAPGAGDAAWAAEGAVPVIVAAPGAGAVEGAVSVVVDAGPGAGDAGPAAESAVPVVDAGPGAGAVEGPLSVVVDAAPVVDDAVSVIGDADNAAPTAETDVLVVESVAPVTDDAVSAVEVAQVETAAPEAEVVRTPVAEAEVAAPEVVAVPEGEVARQAAEFEAAFVQTVCYAAESDPAGRATDAEHGSTQASSVDAPAAEASETAASDAVSSVPSGAEEVSAESVATPSEPGEEPDRSDAAESAVRAPEYHDAWAVSAVRVEHTAEGASGASEL